MQVNLDPYDLLYAKIGVRFVLGLAPLVSANLEEITESKIS